MLYDHNAAVPSLCLRVRITLNSVLMANLKVRSRWPQFIWKQMWRLDLHYVPGDHSQQKDQKFNVGSEPRWKYHVVRMGICRVQRIYTQ